MARTPKIVEIGRPYVKYVLPETRCYASRINSYREDTDFASRWQMLSALRDKNTDLIVCHPRQSSPWDPRWWFRQMGKRNFLKGYMPLTSLIGPQLLRMKTSAPIVVVDFEDSPYIAKSDLFLLDRCVAWFKRELPVDAWQVFMRTDHNAVPTLRYRTKAKNRTRVSKLHPISLGSKIHCEDEYPNQPSVKTSDIFFAGTIHGSSWVREMGIKSIRRLQALGYKVDVPSEEVCFHEFVRRASAAYLVWSPAGYGWDCFRHYEAALCWSVPVMNQPTILRHAPFLDGQHALYYEMTEDGLVHTVAQALSNREKLLQMAVAAREHCLRHHSLEANVRYVVNTAMTLSKRDPFCFGGESNSPNQTISRRAA